MAGRPIVVTQSRRNRLLSRALDQMDLRAGLVGERAGEDQTGKTGSRAEVSQLGLSARGAGSWSESAT